MRKFLWSALSAVALFVSCAEADIEVRPVLASEDFTATFAETRAELDELAVLWNEADVLTIFTKTSHNRKYQVKSLSNGKRTATFSYVTYTGSDKTAISNNYAVYPYNADASLSGEVVTTSINATQVYNAEKVDLANAIMVAKSTSESLQFVNSTALMRFDVANNMPDSYTLSSIKLVSASQKIAGEATIDFSTDCKAVVTEKGVNEVILSDIDTELTLEKQSFYVVLPATSFASKDLTVTFAYADGSEKSFALPAFELTVGTIKTIAYTINDGDDFTGSTPDSGDDFEGNTPGTTTEPASNEIWYTNGSTTAATTPHNSNAFGGATIVSNTYNSDLGCWVIKFDSDVTAIQYRSSYAGAFSQCSSITSITLPSSVKTIDGSTFNRCTSLVEINIPEGVTAINPNSAFYMCTSLVSVTLPSTLTKLGGSDFEDCESLKTVYCKAINPPTGVDDYSFSLLQTYNNETRTYDHVYPDAIYVPSASVEAYKAAKGWTYYADKIVGYDFE